MEEIKEYLLVPLDDVLKCMMDDDEFIRMTAKAYYEMHYSNMNKLYNDHPSK